MPGQAQQPVALSPLHRAGFWVRVLAAFVDFVILAVPLAVFVSFLSVAMGISPAFLDLHPGEPPAEVLAEFGPRFLLISLGFWALSGWLYFALMESSPWQATLGKRLLGLYVVDENGVAPGFWRATGRFASGRLLVHVPLAGGYYFLADCRCVGLLPGKRAVHDMLAGCLVLRERRDGPLFEG
ncbi:MAG: RDD family protein [Candidatus Acidiferrum sp.]